MADYDLRKLQLTELDILIEIDRICSDNNIQYFLCAGTLLGAVRHQGFIPWDNDIDIAMPLSDYKHFCRIAKKEMHEPYFLQTHNTDLTHLWFCKVRKSGTTFVEKGFENFNIHQGVWVDVFPIIGVKTDKKWLSNVNRFSRFLHVVMKKKMEPLEWKQRSIYSKILRFIPLPVIRLLINAGYSLIFKDFHKFEKCYFLSGSKTIYPKYDSEIFQASCKLLFEEHPFPVPIQWDHCLTNDYGDYMTPPPPEKRNTGCHEIAVIDLDKDFREYKGKL